MSPYWKSLKSIRWLTIFLLIMWVIYLFAMSAYVHQMLTVYHRNNIQSLLQAVKDIQKIVKTTQVCQNGLVYDPKTFRKCC